MSDVTVEDGERGTYESCCAVRVAARSATVDQADHPADLVDEVVVDVTEGEFVQQHRELGQAVAARTALTRTLIGQVRRDVSGPRQTAFVAAQQMEDTRARGCPERGETAPGQPRLSDHIGRNPAAVIPTDKQCLEAARGNGFRASEDFAHCKTGRNLNHRGRQECGRYRSEHRAGLC